VAASVRSVAKRSMASYGKRWLGPLMDRDAMTLPERPVTGTATAVRPSSHSLLLTA